jgi:hypothetical protein
MAISKRGQSVNWALPNVLAPAVVKLPAGHLLHVALTLTLVSGNPAGLGQLVYYNGPQGQTTVGMLSEDNAAAWNFSPPMTPSQTVTSVTLMADHSAGVVCAGLPNQSYGIQATSSLNTPTWVAIATNTAGPDGLFSYVDADAKNHTYRFYRSSTP